ncbi:dTMP kinase [Corynebacterium mendelii]|uniref:Thymidylate kinase n=1 Tax=Corynebacterium mendelii TaxID=2765362 RepID=A0A939E0K7_9CORY|nr:dTMP kinase [Corynebacterium mendelii]
MIISIEGIDGAGKNTLVTAICNQIDAEVIAFPRYGVSVEAQLARQALYGKMGDLTDSVNGMAVLFALDRAGAKDRLARYAPGGDLQDCLVLLDRYVASNAAYSVARTSDSSVAQWVYDLEFGFLGLPTPDLQILLATDPAVAGQRASSRAAGDPSRAVDAYESDTALQAATLNAYRDLAATGWASPWHVVAAGVNSPRQTASDILDSLGYGAD